MLISLFGTQMAHKNVGDEELKHWVQCLQCESFS